MEVDYELIASLSTASRDSHGEKMQSCPQPEVALGNWPPRRPRLLMDLVVMDMSW